MREKVSPRGTYSGSEFIYPQAARGWRPTFIVAPIFDLGSFPLDRFQQLPVIISVLGFAAGRIRQFVGSPLGVVMVGDRVGLARVGGGFGGQLPAIVVGFGGGSTVLGTGGGRFPPVGIVGHRLGFGHRATRVLELDLGDVVQEAVGQVLLTTGGAGNFFCDTSSKI